MQAESESAATLMVASDAWEELRIDEIGTIFSGATPSRDVSRYWNGDIDWVTPSELTTLHDKFLVTTRDRITLAGLESCGARVLPPGAVLVTSRASLGMVALASRPVATNQGFKSIVLRRIADPTFYFYMFTRGVPELVRRASGTTFLEIPAHEFGAIKLPVPTLSEQRCIGAILDTVTETGRSTEQIIAKVELVRQGLLHDLLTRGIDENGQLRDPLRHPEQFKGSSLGPIPSEWTVEPFGSLCASSAFGPRFSSDLYARGGALATLRTTDMDDDGNITLDTMPRARIAPDAMASHLLVPGDLLISRSGTCGITGVFPGYETPVVPGAFLIRFRFYDPGLAEFYRRYFNSVVGRPRLDRLAVGGVQKNIKGSEVLAMDVPVCSSDEATRIMAAIESVEKSLQEERAQLGKLNAVKKGLMDDLLTGRVRVINLLDGDAA